MFLDECCCDITALLCHCIDLTLAAAVPVQWKEEGVAKAGSLNKQLDAGAEPLLLRVFQAFCRDAR